jgi:hypothetical protein
MKDQLKRAGYAVVGSYELVYDKAKALATKATKTGRKDLESLYGDLAKRGENVVKQISRSKPAKRAVEGTKQATRQLKGAATSVKKVVGLEEEQKAKAV